MSHKIKYGLILIIFLLESSCAHLFSSGSLEARSQPNWVGQNSRRKENGRIYFIEKMDLHQMKSASEVAKYIYQVQAYALENIAVECSFIPKSSFVDDQFMKMDKAEASLYVQVYVDESDCLKAQRMTELDQIKLFANSGYSEQVFKYRNYSFMQSSILKNISEIKDRKDYFKRRFELAWLKQNLLLHYNNQIPLLNSKIIENYKIQILKLDQEIALFENRNFRDPTIVWRDAMATLYNYQEWTHN